VEMTYLLQFLLLSQRPIQVGITDSFHTDGT
jgi:hypothetical protein